MDQAFFARIGRFRLSHLPPMSPQNIISDISGCYDRALLEGDLFFFPSTVHKHKESNIEVRLPFFSGDWLHIRPACIHGPVHKCRHNTRIIRVATARNKFVIRHPHPIILQGPVVGAYKWVL